MSKLRAGIIGLTILVGLLPTLLHAQQYIEPVEGNAYHVTWHGWSEDGWVHWQNDCYSWGCTGWYVESAGP